MNGTTTVACPRQRGVALITALLITALVTVVAVAMISRQQLDIRRTANMLEADQAYMYALAAEDLAKKILEQDLRDSSNDTLLEQWGTPIPAIPVEGGAISGSIEDLQGRFNLNNLLDSSGQPDPAQVASLQRLMQQVSFVTEDLNLSPALVNRVVDWIDPDMNTSADGAEDQEYLGVTPSYRAANQLMVSPSELALLLDMPAEGAAALRDLVATLPATTAVNVNTAPELVLMALDPNITPQIASELAQIRRNRPFETTVEFTDKLNNDYQITTLAASRVGVTSEYFLVTSTAAIGRTQLRMYSLLARTGGRVTTVRRSIGTY